MKDPDYRLVTVGGGSASLWWKQVPLLNGRTCGFIGNLHAGDEAGATALLDEACRVLADEGGCEWAVGPVDGDTWHNYRVVVESSGVPPFPGEPVLERCWAGWFSGSGFSVLAEYTSSRVNLESANDEGALQRVASRLHALGVVIRQLNLQEWETELERIHAVSLEAFRGAFLYTPLNDGEFRALYEKARPLVDPRWVWIAECDGRAVGFVFAFRLPGQNALFVKTLAVVPGRRFAGLGSVLLDRVQNAALIDGCSHAIHCLQHEANTSLRVSSRYLPEVIRRYALFARKTGDSGVL